jgi:molybdenum cofactor cytidylyltransferase
MPELACVILAAGGSARLGQPKQLVKIEGETLLRRTVRLAGEAGCDPIVVVLGSEAERMRAEVSEYGTVIVTNGDWPSGMGSSLCSGVQAVARLDPQPANVLLLVCDQLALNADVLRRLIERQRTGITASRYGGRPGVPAIFSSAFYPELMAVTGDRGARGILERHASAVTCVDFPEGEADLDTREQLDRVAK